MKNTFLKLVFISLFLASCQQKIVPNDIAKLNGYWEIEKVDLADGAEKNYKVNENFDYFKIVDNKGIRKKVTPLMNGTFLVNDTYEKVTVRFENDKVFLDYTTDYAKWKEELVRLTDDEFVVKNDQNKEYHYKKARPINLLKNGETAK